MKLLSILLVALLLTGCAEIDTDTIVLYRLSTVKDNLKAAKDIRSTNGSYDTVTEDCSALLTSNGTTLVYGETLLKILDDTSSQDLAFMIETNALRELCPNKNIAFNYGVVLSSDINSLSMVKPKMLNDKNHNITNVYVNTYSDHDNTSINKSEDGSCYIGLPYEEKAPIPEQVFDKTNCQYINPTAEFISNPICDESGEVIGLFFKEI